VNSTDVSLSFVDVLPDKHSTSELLRRKMAGIPLEEPEEVLIKRGKGKWIGRIHMEKINNLPVI
jgi:hypothetical protein